MQIVHPWPHTLEEQMEKKQNKKTNQWLYFSEEQLTIKKLKSIMCIFGSFEALILYLLLVSNDFP